MGTGVKYFGDGGPGDGGFEFLVWTEDPGTGIFSLTRGFETLIPAILLKFHPIYLLLKKVTKKYERVSIGNSTSIIRLLY